MIPTLLTAKRHGKLDFSRLVTNTISHDDGAIHANKGYFEAITGDVQVVITPC